MPRTTRSLAWTELKIGLVATIALLLAATTIFLLGSAGGFFWQRYSVKALFGNVAGVRPGSPVRIAGVDVGSVSELRLVGEQVEVVLEIAESQRERVTTDSRATIGSVSLLGEGAIDISPALTGTPIPDWGYVPTGVSSPSMADIASQATAGLDEVTALLQDIRQGRGTMGRLFTDDALYTELTAMVSAAERVTSSVAAGRGTLGRLTTDDALYTQLADATRDLRAITTRIRNGEGSLGKLLHDEAFASALTATTQNVERVTARLESGEGTAGRLLTDEALYERLEGTVGRLEAITTNLQQGEGTLGRLLTDRQLYENMNRTILELREFIAEVRKDPRKYLNVKVSIF
jgi:phospholipid/cholesterol/gamma-HCH transport system substrate-binding protein